MGYKQVANIVDDWFFIKQNDRLTEGGKTFLRGSNALVTKSRARKQLLLLPTAVPFSYQRPTAKPTRRRHSTVVFLSEANHELLGGAHGLRDRLLTWRRSATSVTSVPASPTVALGTTRQDMTIDVSIVITNTPSQPLPWSDCALALEEYRYSFSPRIAKGSDWIEVWAPGYPT